MGHPITGVTSITIAGEQRTLASDMNCAAVLFELKGEHWQTWLVDRFLGEPVDGGRSVTPLSPSDTIVALYALLASDREDHPREESLKSLGRLISLPELPEVQLALARAVMTGFGLPGEFIEAVAKAAGEPRSKKRAAAGIGTTP